LYLSTQNVNDSSNWYRFCHALLDKDKKEGKNLLKAAFLSLPKLAIVLALKGAPSPEEQLQLFLHIGEEDSIDILSTGRNSAEIRKCILSTMPDESKKNTMEKVTVGQREYYRKNNFWAGTPTEEFMEELGPQFHICKSCGHEVKGSKVVIEKDYAVHLDCHEHGDLLRRYI
jgi:hypothetical protein